MVAQQAERVANKQRGEQMCQHSANSEVCVTTGAVHDSIHTLQTLEDNGYKYVPSNHICTLIYLVASDLPEA